MFAENAMTIVRKFKPMDLKRVYEIECKSFKDPYHVMFLLSLYELYSETFFVAEKNGYVVGYVISRKMDNKVHIIAIAVDSVNRGMGIGKGLMEATMKTFESIGIREVYLEVRVSNTHAIRFYEAIGFQKKGLLRSYYSDGEDGVLLKRGFVLPT
jgi:ribosomal-protein-alanine N-acetyltransferase